LKVRTHLLILVCSGFGGALVLSLMAFLTINHYRTSSDALNKNLIDFRNQKIFEQAHTLTQMTKELFLSMESQRFHVYQALMGDEMALIKESYNHYAYAFVEDREYYEHVKKIKLSDGSTLLDYLADGSFKTRILKLEKALNELFEKQIEILAITNYTSEFNRLNRFSNNFLPNQKNFLLEKSKEIPHARENFLKEHKLKPKDAEGKVYTIMQSKMQKLHADFRDKYNSLNQLIDAMEAVNEQIKLEQELDLKMQVDELEEEKANSMLILGLLAFAFLSIIAFVSLSTYRTLANPIRKLEQAATNSLDLNMPFTMVEMGPFEIRSLTRRLQGLVIGLEETVKARTSSLQNKTNQLQKEIQQRRELETQLVHAQKMEAVGQLASGIAHEINSPSQFANDNILFLKDAVDGFIAQIQGKEEAPDEKELTFLAENAPEAATQAAEGISRITTIVKSMKNFAYRDAASAKRPNELNQAIRSTIVVATNEWKYHAELDLDLDESLPMVPCNIGEINQVVLNLIVNGAHAIRERFNGEQKGLIVVSTKHYPQADCVVVMINDNGGGIPKKVQDRIFEPFFTTKEVGVGTGQGLAIAHNVIVKSHGGQIWFDSRQGDGTTFYIKLFLKEAST